MQRGQFLECQPANCIVIGEKQLTVYMLGMKAKQPDDFIAIVVNGLSEKGADLTMHAEFLDEFPLQAFSWGFLPFEFAAGKLPVAGQVQAGALAGREYSTIFCNDGGGNGYHKSGQWGIGCPLKEKVNGCGLNPRHNTPF